MKKWLIWIISIILLTAAGVGVYILVTQAIQNSEQTQTDTGNPKTACEVFTQDLAIEILGRDAQKSVISTEPQALSEMISVSNCAYEVGQGLKTVMAHAIVRSAQNEKGYPINQAEFLSARTKGVKGSTTSQVISGMGDAAYYNPSFKQVNVLIDDGRYWVIVQASDQEQSEELARRIVEKM